MATASRAPLIATRATPETKAKFAALAASRSMTESALLSRMIDTVLAQNRAPADDTSWDDTPNERVSLRLRRGDRTLADARAKQRGMKTASYLAMLIRAHVRHAAPLPSAELHELKRAVGELTGASRHLRLLALQGSSVDAGTASADLAEELQRAITHVEAVRRCVAEVVRINLKSWEAGNA